MRNIIKKVFLFSQNQLSQRSGLERQQIKSSLVKVYFIFNSKVNQLKFSLDHRIESIPRNMSSVKNLCAVCDCELDLKACSACGQIFYCSVEHQKQNWKEHKGNCKPFRVSQRTYLLPIPEINYVIQIVVDKKRCRFLEASREIKSGTIIFSENPLCIGPDWSCDLLETAGSFNCVGCFQPIRVFNSHCPKCKWPVCTTECVGLQNSKLHDIECSLLKGGLGVKHESDYRAIRDYYRTDVLFALKCLLLQLKQPKKFEALMELQSHEDARKTAANFK